jgi:hypothetical protein
VSGVLLADVLEGGGYLIVQPDHEAASYFPLAPAGQERHGLDAEEVTLDLVARRPVSPTAELYLPNG